MYGLSIVLCHLFFPAMGRCKLEVEPAGLRRHQKDQSSLQRHLAAWSGALQQVCSQAIFDTCHVPLSVFLETFFVKNVCALKHPHLSKQLTHLGEVLLITLSYSPVFSVWSGLYISPLPLLPPYAASDTLLLFPDNQFRCHNNLCQAELWLAVVRPQH